MVVLSLFDGISVGCLALKRANIVIDKYFASEIDDTAIRIATHNHPEIIEIGNVRNVVYDKDNGILHTENGDFEVNHIDLLIGGSPCTDFSSIGYNNGMTSEDNEALLTLEQYLELKRNNVQMKGQSYLFWEYIRLLQETKATYFLLENVIMPMEWRTILDKYLGTYPIDINSSLVSAQNRRRQYWTNIPHLTMPFDEFIELDDILDENADTTDCSDSQIVQKSLPNLVKKYKYIPNRFNAYNTTKITNKACTLTRGSMVSSSCATLIWVKTPNGVHVVNNGVLDNEYPVKLEDGRYNLRRLNILEMERLQTLPDNYTNIPDISDALKSVCIGNSWTVNVIAHIFRGLVNE